jgi:hypothetical protein
VRFGDSERLGSELRDIDEMVDEIDRLCMRDRDRGKVRTD